MGTLLRDRFVRLWGARRNLCHVCVSAIPKGENNERRRMKKEGGSALRRSRGKFTTLNAFARRSEVKLKLAERNIMAKKRAVLWNLLSKFQTCKGQKCLQLTDNRACLVHNCNSVQG